MSSTADTANAMVAKTDLKLEVVVIPVADAERSKAFYERLGWRLDADFALRQRLPRRSVHAAGFGRVDPVRHEDHGGRSRQRPGSLPDRLGHRGRARRARGARRRDQRGLPSRSARRPVRTGRRTAASAGPAPEHETYGSFATFSDPDGNEWLLQEVTVRLPGARRRH